MSTKYLKFVPVVIDGQDAMAGVTTYNYTPPFRGSPHRCSSDWDYSGNEEIEVDLLTIDKQFLHPRDGKLTDEEDEYVCQTVSDFMQKKAEEDYDEPDDYDGDVCFGEGYF